VLSVYFNLKADFICSDYNKYMIIHFSKLHIYLSKFIANAASRYRIIAASPQRAHGLRTTRPRKPHIVASRSVVFVNVQNDHRRIAQ